MLDFIQSLQSNFYVWNKEFEKFIIRNLSFFRRRRNKKGRDVYFWITPWGDTPCPWYTMAFALIYKYYTGENVKLILNDLWGSDGRYKKVIDLIKRDNFLLKCAGLDLIELSDIKNDTKLDDYELNTVKNIARLNAIKKLQSSNRTKMYFAEKERYCEILFSMAKKIKSLLYQRKNDVFVVPGGMFQETGVLTKFCSEFGIDMYAFDSGDGRVVLANGCAAAQVGNIKNVVEAIKNSKVKDKVIEEGHKVLKQRINAENDISDLSKGEVVQPCKRNSVNFDGEIVIFPNIEHDTAALGTHTLFEDDYEWLMETIKFILDYTNSNVVVREHPLQRKFNNRRAFSYLQHEFGSNERFQFISYSEKVNSYDLIVNAKVVIVNTSTVGLEATMLGKKIITESDSYYGESGFCSRCKEKKDYFDEIMHSINTKQAVSKAKQDEAAVYYALSQLCSSAITCFTPQNDDFNKWIKMRVPELIRYEDTKLILDSIIKKKPLIQLKCAKRFLK